MTLNARAAGSETAFLATTRDAEATRRLGQRLAKLLRPGDVVLLDGLFGAGKTTLTQGIARGLGIVGPITSPSFSLINEYPFGPDGSQALFCHVDLYRVNSQDEVEQLDLASFAERDAILVIEWGAQHRHVLPDAELSVVIESPSEVDRTLIFSALSDHGRQILRALASDSDR